jgi:hypothetical protein
MNAHDESVQPAQPPLQDAPWLTVTVGGGGGGASVHVTFSEPALASPRLSTVCTVTVWDAPSAGNAPETLVADVVPLNAPLY